MTSILTLTAAVLRDPNALVDAHDNGVDLPRLAPPLLAITLIGGALFGLMVGSQRGELQLLYAAVKMPVLLLAPPLVALPALHSLWRAAGVEVRWGRLSLAALAAMARSAVLAAALGPVLWLLYSLRLDYHDAVLLMVASIGLAGLPGVAALVRALPKGGDLRFLAAAGSALALFLAFAQTGWLLRPFIARPQAEVSFLRPVEEDVFSSLSATRASSKGDYRGWEVRSDGVLGDEEAK